MVEEFGEAGASDIVMLGSYDTGNNTYYKLDYIIRDNGERIEASDLEFFGLEESCCGGGKKKGKKKGKKSGFVPFWARKKDNINEDFGNDAGTTFSNICKKYIANDYFTTLVTEKGLRDAIETVLADIRSSIGY